MFLFLAACAFLLAVLLFNRLTVPRYIKPSLHEQQLKQWRIDHCYLSTGHDGHDLLAPGQKCKACPFVAPEDNG